MTHPFEQLIFDRFAQSISTWDTERHPDVYAISLLYDDFWSQDANGHEIAIQNQISLSFNTLSHYQTQIASASSPAEAKWNFAFWLQETTASAPRYFGDGTDPPADDLALRDAWCASLGIHPKSTDESGRFIYDGRIDEAVRGLCQRVARAMHEKGVIMAKLGRFVPVLVHGLDKIDEDAEATRLANPPGLSSEFEEW